MENAFSITRCDIASGKLRQTVAAVLSVPAHGLKEPTPLSWGLTELRSLVNGMQERDVLEPAWAKKILTNWYIEQWLI